MNISESIVGNNGERLLKLPEVISRVAMSRSAIYRDIAAGSFPRPVRVSKQTVAWVQSEVEAWVRDRIAASRGAR